MESNNVCRRLIISCALVLLCTGICWPQEFVNTRKISLNRGDTLVIAGILADVKIEEINPMVYYFWYDNGQIFSNQGGHGGNLLHGDYVEYGPAGTLLLKGQYDKGTQSGKWNYWYPVGALKESIHYENGLLEGDNIRYSMDGKIYFQANYHEDQLHGKMTTVKGDTLFQIKYKKGEELKREAMHVFQNQK